MDSIKEVTITEYIEDGFLATTSEGDSVYIIANPVVSSGLNTGDTMIAVLVPNNRPNQSRWFADWAVPKGRVTMGTVQSALASLQSGGAWLAEEIGLDEGDLLYRAGIATKYIILHKKKRIDSYKDIVYSVYPERIAIDEFEEIEE